MQDPKWTGRWNELKGSIQEQWDNLTADDLKQIDGRRDQPVARIQEGYGKARDQVEHEVEAWETRSGLR